jgi:hypothetical protein
VKIGIVGHEAAKFTTETEEEARTIIRSLIRRRDIEVVISGECHLGGIDIWAKEEAKKEDVSFVGFPPKTLQWNGGYKERNIQIAEESDAVICIVVKKLPDSYQGMRFPYCYHCKTDSHIKSGGCWTARHAGKIGKQYAIIEI